MYNSPLRDEIRQTGLAQPGRGAHLHLRSYDSRVEGHDFYAHTYIHTEYVWKIIVS